MVTLSHTIMDCMLRVCTYEINTLCTQLYRLFWLVVALHDFAGLDASEPTWPRAWADALGIISAHSPPLILATRVASACKVRRW